MNNNGEKNTGNKFTKEEMERINQGAGKSGHEKNKENESDNKRDNNS